MNEFELKTLLHHSRPRSVFPQALQIDSVIPLDVSSRYRRPLLHNPYQVNKATIIPHQSPNQAQFATMFPLHSSADHAFVINRGVHQQGKRSATGAMGATPDAIPYTFRGDADESVSWESVKLVRYRNKDVQTCPICLEVPVGGQVTIEPRRGCDVVCILLPGVKSIRNFERVIRHIQKLSNWIQFVDHPTAMIKEEESKTRLYSEIAPWP